MQNLVKDIENSVRKIFKLFFKSSLYLRKNTENDCLDLWGVDIMMDIHGRKRMSLLLEQETMKSVIEQLTGNDDIENDNVAYDIIGEMASIIVGNAFNDNYEDIEIYGPTRSKNVNIYTGTEALMFSSRLGRFAIAFEEI